MKVRARLKPLRVGHKWEYLLINVGMTSTITLQYHSLSIWDKVTNQTETKLFYQFDTFTNASNCTHMCTVQKNKYIVYYLGDIGFVAFTKSIALPAMSIALRPLFSRLFGIPATSASVKRVLSHTTCKFVATTLNVASILAKIFLWRICRWEHSIVLLNQVMTLWRPPGRQSARMSKITNDILTRCGTGCFIAVPIWQQ